MEFSLDAQVVVVVMIGCAFISGVIWLAIKGYDQAHEHPHTKALRAIYACMGPKVPACCSGCHAEWCEALRIIENAGVQNLPYRH
jgi:uncharacterized protein YneF (UPF0154 family)